MRANARSHWLLKHFTMVSMCKRSMDAYWRARRHSQSRIAITRSVKKRWIVRWKLRVASNDAREIAFTLGRTGRLAMYRGKLERAIELHKESIAIYELIADEFALAQANFEVGLVLGCGAGMWADVTPFHRRSIALSRKLGLVMQPAYAMEDLGTSYLNQRDFPEAERLYRESREIFRSLGDWFGYSKATNGLGAVLIESQSDWDTGFALKIESIAILRHHGQRRQLAHQLFALSVDLLVHGHHEAAQNHASEALKLFENIGAGFLAGTHAVLAHLALGRGDAMNARRHIGAGLRLTQHFDADFWSAWCLSAWVALRLHESSTTPIGDAERTSLLAFTYKINESDHYFRVRKLNESLTEKLENNQPAALIHAAIAERERLNMRDMAQVICETMS